MKRPASLVAEAGLAQCVGLHLSLVAAMGDAVRDAEARLAASVVRIRAKYAERWRFRSYVLPIGLVAGALLVSAEFRQPGGMLTMTPLIAAAIWSRALGGITAARVATALVALVAIPEGFLTWETYAPSWAPFLWLGLIGLCIERASSARYDLTPPRQSEGRLARSLLTYRAPLSRRPG